MEEIMNKVTGFLGGLTTVLLSFVSLGILAEVIFGVGVFGAIIPIKLSTMLTPNTPIPKITSASMPSDTNKK
mgnify:CR=1 FL=1